MISEEVITRANTALLEMLDTFEKTGGFVIEQAPLVVQELLRWHFIESFMKFSFLFVLGTILFSLCFRSWRSAANKEVDGLSDWEKSGVTQKRVLSSMGWVTSAFFFPIALTDHTAWLQILIAPRLYLLEYAAMLVK